MAEADADRNLLFGLLALQNGLVDRDRLIAAFHAWTRDKVRPLADHLVARGDLDADQRAVLGTLAALQLKKNGGDARRSLGAIPADSTARSGIASLGDPELTRTFEYVGVGSTEPDHDGDRRTTHVVPTAFAGGARFSILRPHARGGLGAVFVARDAELNREVALKQILDTHADDPASRQRFLLEAEITGGLEHPGIVPVYGLGHYDDGRPYYAMRFIKGDSLKDTIASFHRDECLPRDAGAWTLALQKLLRQFLDVCDAVEYAHSRGVLHRDLKPSNVMVGRYGETLVVDWGLAKVIGRADPTGAEEPELAVASSGSSETLPGSVVGTPGYMSPEQAEGRLDRLGPASDVYSLGATLYCLLTGTAPFAEGERGVPVLTRVARGEFPTPREVNPSVPQALEAVCLKAMATRPADRYASPRALADDLERWLADEPVSARRERLANRLARWGRRHKPAVAGLAALLLTAVISLAIGLGVVAHQKRQVQTQKDRADVQTQIARGQTLRADLQARIARTEKGRAEERFTLALDALQSLVFEISQSKLQYAPGGQKLRREILKAAAANLEKLSRNAERTRDVNQGIISAHLQSGEVALLLGDARKARRHFEAGHQVALALAKADRGDPQARRVLAIAYDRLGDVLLRLGDAATARDHFRTALGLREALSEADPDGTQPRRDLAISYDKLGDVSLQSGDAAAARDLYRNGLRLREALAKTDRESLQARRDLSVSHEKLGDACLQFGDAGGARDHYRQELELRTALASADPEDARARRDLSVSFEKLGEVSLELGDAAAAREYYRKDLELAKALAKADPESAQARRDLSVSYNRLGDVSMQLADAAAARGNYRQALELALALTKADPDNAQARRDLTVSYIKLGDAIGELGDAAGARDHYTRSLELAEALDKAEPKNAQARRDLSVSYDRLGEVNLRLGDAAAARDHYRRSLELAEDRDSAQARRDLAASYECLGEVSLQLGAAAGARDFYGRGVALREALARADPDNAQAQADLVNGRFFMGETSRAKLGHAEALPWYQRAREDLDRILAAGKLVGQPQWIERRDDLVKRIDLCAAASRARADADFARSQPATIRAELLAARGEALAGEGRFAEAVRTAEQLRGLAPGEPASLLWAARVIGRVVAVMPGANPDREHYAARAVSLLAEARAACGFTRPTDRDRLTYADDYAALRDRADFRGLQADLAMPADPFAN